MIIIYNLPGLIIGALGVMAGVLATVVTGFLSVGLLVLAIIWFGAGLWWRFWMSTPLRQNVYPALFFIPLPFIAVPVAMLAVPLFVFEVVSHNRPVDPVAEKLRADEQLLSNIQLSGDVKLSSELSRALQAITVDEVKAERFSIFTRQSPTAVLVLIKASNLKKMRDPARQQLLDVVASRLRANNEVKNKQIYIGVKGTFAFGAIMTPPNKVEIDSVVSDSRLHSFYATMNSTTDASTSNDRTSDNSAEASERATPNQ